MATIIIPNDLKGLDVWDNIGKITVTDKITLEEARRLEAHGVRIIEQEEKPKPKKK